MESLKISLVDVVTGANGERYEVMAVAEDDFVKAHAFVWQDGRRRGTCETVPQARKLAEMLAGRTA